MTFNSHDVTGQPEANTMGTLKAQSKKLGQKAHSPSHNGLGSRESRFHFPLCAINPFECEAHKYLHDCNAESLRRIAVQGMLFMHMLKKLDITVSDANLSGELPQGECTSFRFRINTLSIEKDTSDCASPLKQITKVLIDESRAAKRKKYLRRLVLHGFYYESMTSGFNWGRCFDALRVMDPVAVQPVIVEVKRTTINDVGEISKVGSRADMKAFANNNLKGLIKL